MPGLLSGSLLRRGGSGEFIDIAGSQPQLPPTDSTSTGFTLVTNNLLQTSYRSSLGNIEFKNAQLYSNLTTGSIRILATGTNIVSTNTNTGLLIVDGDVGVRGTMNIGKDIVVNGITIGQGYQGINNIVVRGTALPQISNYNDGQESIAIGHDTLLGIGLSYKNIAIGRYALSSGTYISNSIAIGDSALKLSGVYQTLVVATITNVTLSNPVVITAPGHNLPNSTAIKLLNIAGTTQLNDVVYYTSATSTSTVSLYLDILRTVPINGTGFTAYTGGGTINTLCTQNSNIAIGASAGEKLINGENNIFIANAAASQWISGSNNVILGQGAAKFINSGSGIISIGGDNLVNGLDNQVNIGSVFYFDGRGYAYIAANTAIGLGSESTSTNTGAFNVAGGAGINGNLYVSGELHIENTSTSSAVVVAGGLSIAGNIYSVLGGNPEENFLLYTPKVTVSSTVPTSAKIGDIWIDSITNGYLQYIKTGTSTFWVQVAVL